MLRPTNTAHGPIASPAIWLILIIILPMFLTACSSAAAGQTADARTTKPERPLVRLSTTTSVNDTGLLPLLQAAFKAHTGYELEIVANGTGAALKLGESGDADVLLVHAREAEEAFVAAGHGLERLPFMHNFFVIAGPADDPAGVAGCSQAADAFAAIVTAGQPFVSRGDDSGTHKAELKIWSAAALDPGGDWYLSVGKGMGPSLLMAAEIGAYILTDQATFLATAGIEPLQILLNASEDLKNTYALIAVNGDKHPDINTAGAQAWIDFIFSAEAGCIISGFGLKEYGNQLFIYDGRGDQGK